MSDEVAAKYSGVSKLLSDQLGLKMAAANFKLLDAILVSARQNEDNRPNKPSLTRQITEALAAAIKMGEALASPPVLSWLKAADPGFLAKQPDYWSDIVELQQTFEAALLITPKGRGRARSATPEEISPRATCALLVAELFELAGQERPRPRNATAHTIAEALWLASGGPPWPGHAKDLASWRPYFDEMKRASLDYRQVLRSLVRTRHGTEKQPG
jgi:hypothetical protein